MSVQVRERPGRLWRVLMRPVGPTLVMGRWKARPSARALVEGSGLPSEVRCVLLLVLSRTRLWSGEQREVARELIAHFGDALESGAPASEAVAHFGDPLRAARMIRRAKKRQRGLLWWGWVRAWQAVGLALCVSVVIYAGLAARHWTGEPRVERNYRAEMNAAVEALPEEMRAWPLYKEAMLAADVNPPELLGAPWNALPPGDERWPAVASYLDEIAHTLELTRAAAERPALGLPIRLDGDPEIAAHQLARHGAVYIRGERDEDAPLLRVLMPELGEFRRLSRNLGADARLAASEGDLQRFNNDLSALFRMGEQLRESPLPIVRDVGLGVFATGVRTLGDVLRDYPSLFDEPALASMAHLLSGFGGGEFRADLDHELVFRDVLQRIYTDSGSGDGRITPEGIEFLRDYRTFAWRKSVAERRPTFDDEFLALPDTEFQRKLLTVAAPVLNAGIAGRREQLRVYRELSEAYRAEAALPAWERRGEADRAYLERLGPEGALVRYWPVAVMMPAFSALTAQSDGIAMQRDAVLVALALEAYRRNEGAYPASLSQLAPRYIPAVPRDRFDGELLKYRVMGDSVVLYSVGADRQDQGGQRVQRELEASVRNFRIPPARARVVAQGDWVLWSSEPEAAEEP